MNKIMEFLNEQKLSIGQYRLIDNNNNKYQLSVEKDCCPTDPRSRGEVYMWTIQDCVKVTQQDSEGNILSVTFEPEEEMGFEYIFGNYNSLPTVQDIREQFGEFKEIQRIK